MEIVKASKSDIPELCQLLDILFSQEEEFVPDHQAQSNGLSRIIENPDIGCIMVARANERIVGMVNILFTVSTALGDRVALFEDMVVLPEARSSGVGSRLLDSAIQTARMSGCKRITLLTDQTNVSAQRFYARHGFRMSAMIPLRLTLGE